MWNEIPLARDPIHWLAGEDTLAFRAFAGAFAEDPSSLLRSCRDTRE